LSRFLGYYVPAILWACFIFVLSSIPNLTAPRLGFRVEDKVAHMIEFGLLGYLTTRAFDRQWNGNRRRAIIVALALCTVYAVTDELHQLRVPGRFAEGNDVAADVLGVLLAQVLFSQKRALVGWLQNVIGSKGKAP